MDNNLTNFPALNKKNSPLLLGGRSYEVLRVVHDESLGALEHFRMLAEQEETEETVSGNINKLVGYKSLIVRYWHQQAIYYFTLGWKGMKTLRSKRKDVAFWHQWHPGLQAA